MCSGTRPPLPTPASLPASKPPNSAHLVSRLAHLIRAEKLDLSVLLTPPASPILPAHPPRMAARGSHWSFLEKARFEAALHRHGPFAWDRIIDAVGTRTEKQVKAYAARYRRRKRLAARIDAAAAAEGMHDAPQLSHYAAGPAAQGLHPIRPAPSPPAHPVAHTPPPPPQPHPAHRFPQPAPHVQPQPKVAPVLVPVVPSAPRAKQPDPPADWFSPPVDDAPPFFPASLFDDPLLMAPPQEDTDPLSDNPTEVDLFLDDALCAPFEKSQPPDMSQDFLTPWLKSN